ncbi:MAG: hypothetical protein M3460_19740 [Actinomycetota bacterium]|nr:hypothetical protein [Actinomycetota bacterium]
MVQPLLKQEQVGNVVDYRDDVPGRLLGVERHRSNQVDPRAFAVRAAQRKADPEPRIPTGHQVLIALLHHGPVTW